MIDLKWNDLISPTMTPDEYLKEFGDKIAYNYKTYEPKTDVLEEIKELLKSKKEAKDVTFHILYGIMVNALHKPGETIWHKTRSPPEAVNPKFDLKAIPTFYFFNRNNEFLGMIKERPKLTIEEDTLEIIKEGM